MQLLVNGSKKGRTASESFNIAQYKQHLQDKIDQFHNKGLAVMGTNLPEVSAKYTSTTKHAEDLDQLDDEEGDEGAWLATGDAEIREEGPEITPEIFHSIFPQPSQLTKGRAWVYKSLETWSCS